MSINPINPHSGCRLIRREDCWEDPAGRRFPIIQGVGRIVEPGNYAESFGFQWTKFAQTQIDAASNRDLSRVRLFAETGWSRESLAQDAVLEVGSGAGRFTQVLLDHTDAEVYSVDYSRAVEANYANNGHHGARLRLFQASIYELPFADGSFDRVFCFGVPQHTPDFEASVRALVAKAHSGGEIVVDFYPVNGWWTKVNAKYLLRPFTRRLSHQRLLRLIEENVGWLIRLHFLLKRVGLGFLNRFLPLCNVSESFPPNLTPRELREWAVLDTFDQYSPAYDRPQRIRDVAGMFERAGATVTFAGRVSFGEGMWAAVVRARRR